MLQGEVLYRDVFVLSVTTILYSNGFVLRSIGEVKYSVGIVGLSRVKSGVGKVKYSSKKITRFTVRYHHNHIYKQQKRLH